LAIAYNIPFSCLAPKHCIFALRTMAVGLVPLAAWETAEERNCYLGHLNQTDRCISNWTRLVPECHEVYETELRLKDSVVIHDSGYTRQYLSKSGRNHIFAFGRQQAVGRRP
jgi:hypothetical protein